MRFILDKIGVGIITGRFTNKQLILNFAPIPVAIRNKMVGSIECVQKPNM